MDRPIQRPLWRRRRVITQAAAAGRTIKLLDGQVVSETLLAA